ncbi:SIMPL domain-containing protein [Pseudonocardia sp.]|uniref:SIMPL domain-containing protein n=1 Tax=Pseudonocardia sp. TaxID=60912 RepID=UPI002635BB30|nr:SIMPL domain-containing protein [Pseudonocardia sp.]
MTEIVTEGNGWHERPGDRAELDVGFTATGRTRAGAVAALGERVAAAATALDTDRLTIRHRRLWVHNEWRRERVVGCRAGEDIGLLLTDVGALEEILSALIAAEPTALTGPRWTLADPAGARREAQRRAVTDARDRAEGYAAALGRTLGPLLRLSETGVPEHHPAMFARTAADDSNRPPDVRDLGLEPEPVRVTVRCTTAWRLT